ncbi:hypothetical protein A8B75_18790 [Sphingomonadales bacterium EhC05]|nr:hypothetical protein A8B75_18790 [Sphingomonadales bacterium EhC05]
MDLRGSTAGLGTSSVKIDECAQNVYDSELCEEEALASLLSPSTKLQIVAQKRAILQSLGIFLPTEKDFKNLKLSLVNDSRISVRARGRVQDAMRKQSIIDFRTSFTTNSKEILATAIAIAANDQ